jgi:hypothetical protein
MSAGQSVSGKPTNFPTKAHEFFAFWAASRAGNAKGRKFVLPALLYSHLPGAPVALQQSRILHASKNHSITSRKEMTSSVTLSLEGTMCLQ